MDRLSEIKSRLARVVRDQSGNPRQFDGQLVDDAARLVAEVEWLQAENEVLRNKVMEGPGKPETGIPATKNHPLTLSEVLALPEGARVWVEERYGGGRGGEHFRAKKDGDADVLRRADNPDNGCWLKEPFFGDYWRVWSLPVAPTEDELRGNPWTKEGE